MALTPQQTQELQGAIERRRAALVSELHEDMERVRRDRHEDLAGASPDPGDESVATLIADLDHADVGRDLDELRGLEAARGRLSDGSYGVDEGLIFSFPVTSDGQGGYSIVQNLPMSDWAKGQLAKTLQELREEKAVVADLLK